MCKGEQKKKKKKTSMSSTAFWQSIIDRLIAKRTDIAYSILTDVHAVLYVHTSLDHRQASPLIESYQPGAF